MSNRWKKKQLRKCSKRSQIAVSTEEGTFIGQKRSRSGWMTLEYFCANGEEAQAPESAVQQSSCGVTGEVFVKPFEGRFKKMPREKLRKMIAEIRSIFERVGHPPVLDPDQPLWMQAEFLDNLLDFEMNPPCGCPSGLRQAVKLV